MKKIKSIPLLLPTILYLVIASIFNYSLYSLSAEKKPIHQYYLITFYFLGEIFSFILFLFPQKDVFLSDGNISSIFSHAPSNLIRSPTKSEDRSDEGVTIDVEIMNNNKLGDEEFDKSLSEPFVGLKWICFIIPGVLDFLSKFLILNGIHLLGADTILRHLVLILSTFFLAKKFLNMTFDTSTKGGSFLIIITMIVICAYYQLSHSISGLYLSIEENKNLSLGIGFCLLGELLSSIQYIIQAKYFILGEIYFYRVVAYEGLVGFTLSDILLLYSINNKCPFTQENYKIMFCNGNKIESDIFTMFNDLTSKNVLLWSLSYIILSIFHSLLGVAFIRYNGIMSRVAIDVCRIGFWLIELAVIKHNYFNIMATIICFISIIIILGGMIICSELGRYAIIDTKTNSGLQKYIKRQGKEET